MKRSCSGSRDAGLVLFHRLSTGFWCVHVADSSVLVLERPMDNSASRRAVLVGCHNGSCRPRFRLVERPSGELVMGGLTASPTLVHRLVSRSDYRSPFTGFLTCRDAPKLFLLDLFACLANVGLVKILKTSRLLDSFFDVVDVRKRVFLPRDHAGQRQWIWKSKTRDDRTDDEIVHG